MRSLTGPGLLVLLVAFVLMPAVTPANATAVDDSLATGATPDTSAASPDDPLFPPVLLSAASSIEGDSLRRTADPQIDEAALRAWKADSSTIRFEIGARSEVSNESYYEDAFVDTTFLGRRRVGTPEWRHASIVAGAWNGTRGHQATQYQLLGEVSYGDLVQRGSMSARFRALPGDEWVFSFQPNAEYSQDRTFGRDLEEWRAAAGLGARRILGDDRTTTAELGVRGDFLRTRGLGSEYLLDRNSGGASVALDHLGLNGGEWRFAYRLFERTFPDSSDRDHVEHLSEGRWKWTGTGGTSFSADGVATRRLTVREVAVSRDNYWNMEGGVEARAFTYTPTPLRARVGGEIFRYDREDSTLFFNYGVVRAQAALGWERNSRWSLSVGPRAEVLTAPLNRDESYREVAGVLEIEYLGKNGWWNLGPIVGWRNYDVLQMGALRLPPLHSPFAFYELNLISDQPLSSHLRLRAIAAVRVESHDDPSQDAMSLYASGEVRWR